MSVESFVWDIVVPAFFLFLLQAYLDRMAGYSRPTPREIDLVGRRFGERQGAFLRAVPALRLIVLALLFAALGTALSVQQHSIRIVSGTIVAACIGALSIMVNWRGIWPP